MAGLPFAPVANIGRCYACAYYSLLRPWTSTTCMVSSPAAAACGSIPTHDQPFHALDCSASQWHKIQRHNLVRDLLIQFLRRHNPHRVEPEPVVGSLNGLPITAEDNLGEFDILHTAHRRRARHCRRRLRPPPNRLKQSPPGRRIVPASQLRDGHFRADLGVYPATGGRIIIDVAVGISHPTLRPSPHPSSYDPVGEHRENAKLYRYRKLSGIDADDPEQFVPFAMDATGHLGARASAFLGRALAESSCAGARTEFETQLGAAMARFNALASLVRDASHL